MPNIGGGARPCRLFTLVAFTGSRQAESMCGQKFPQEASTTSSFVILNEDMLPICGSSGCIGVNHENQIMAFCFSLELFCESGPPLSPFGQGNSTLRCIHDCYPKVELFIAHMDDDEARVSVCHHKV